jgi:hypothetical protein
MDAKKKPSMFIAVIFTVAAVCSLMTSLLLTRGNRNGGLIAFGLLTSALLVVSAIGNWVTYFCRWVDAGIERRHESTTTKE